MNDMNVQKHAELLSKLHEIYIQKNLAYGNSFDKSCDNFGVISAMVRMSDKWNRLMTLTRHEDIPRGDEGVKDTLLDLANYCVMTYMWLENNKNNVKENKENE